MPPESNTSRQFITKWHQRNLTVVDTHDIKRLLESAAKIPALTLSFNGRMLLKRAEAELSTRQAAPPVLPAPPAPAPALHIYDSRAAYNATRP